MTDYEIYDKVLKGMNLIEVERNGLGSGTNEVYCFYNDKMDAASFKVILYSNSITDGAIISYTDTDNRRAEIEEEFNKIKIELRENTINSLLDD